MPDAIKPGTFLDRITPISNVPAATSAPTFGPLSCKMTPLAFAIEHL
jgi:hypothetical protein